MPVKSFVPELLRISYYKAPRVSAVTPVTIPPRRVVIELVTEGVVYFQTEGAERILGCGALFWHMAGEETICRTEPEAPYECLALGFTVPARAPRPAPRLSVIGDHQRARELCGELLRAYHDPAIDRESLGAYAYGRLKWETHLCATQKTAAVRPAAVDAGLDFVEKNFQRAEVGVAEIARAAAISVPHIHALFREHLGQTPHHALTVRRIREAKWLLTVSHTAIKAIAMDCGFLNIETFYRAFKKTVGTSPHEFRTRHGAPILADISRR